jgi:hypothetical protein
VEGKRRLSVRYARHVIFDYSRFMENVAGTQAGPAVWEEEGRWSQMKSRSCRWLRASLWLLTIVPLVFFVMAVQYSAIIFPFWDHCEMIRYFAMLHDHTLRLSDLWAPHNHSRPLTLRSLVLLNGSLTGWDIRSEYIYLIASVLAAFALQALCLRRLLGAWSSKCLSLVLLLSVISFSPAGHNNHWWSFMIQLDLTHLLVAAALLTVCFGPRSWANNILAAILCWLATYTLTNGLVAFAVAALLVQFTSSNIRRFDRFTAFWCANIAAVLAVYLPHLNESGGALRPLSQLEFSLAYLGSPLASLLIFPYRDMFEIPSVTLRNALVGSAVLAVSVCVAFLLRDQIRRARPAPLLFLGFSLFALGSAILTSWGRANFDAYGVANANASRYTIFGAYALYALIYAAAAELPMSDVPGRLASVIAGFRVRRLALCACGIFLLLATLSYWHSRVIYANAHYFNRILAAAFLRDDAASLKFVYPNIEAVQEMKGTLRRLGIGPYYLNQAQTSGAGSTVDLLQTLAQNKVADQFGIDGWRDLPGLGPVVFATPHSRFALTADHVRSVRFEFGITDTALQASPLPDGVTFLVLLKHAKGSEEVLWTRTLRPVAEPEDRGVQQADVSVSGGSTDQLVFETRAVKNPINNWAFWRGVVIFK